MNSPAHLSTSWLAVVNLLTKRGSNMSRPTLMFIVIGILSSFASLFLVEAMSHIRGNERFQAGVEFTTIAALCLGSKSHYVLQAILYLALQSVNISSIIISCQVHQAGITGLWYRAWIPFWFSCFIRLVELASHKGGFVVLHLKHRAEYWCVHRDYGKPDIRLSLYFIHSYVFRIPCNAIAFVPLTSCLDFCCSCSALISFKTRPKHHCPTDIGGNAYLHFYHLGRRIRSTQTNQSRSRRR